MDTSIFGKTPAIWEIIVEQPEAFESHSIELNIPHTDYLRSCHDCGGIRRKRCDNCDITGWVSDLLDLEMIIICIQISSLPFLLIRQVNY